MLKVTFDGVEFTKASEVAKQFGYTADYLGQLCRARKVNARLVGRTWFVNVPSLESHREKRYKSSEKKEVAATPEKTDTTINNREPAKKTYLKRVQSPKSRVRHLTANKTNSQQPGNPIALQYEPDDFSLIPKVESSPKITLLKVGIAESESLKIRSDTKKSSYLRPQPLPDVALSGKLKVHQIETETESADTESSDKRDKSNNNTHLVRKDANKETEIVTEVTEAKVTVIKKTDKTETPQQIRRKVASNSGANSTVHVLAEEVVVSSESRIFNLLFLFSNVSVSVAVALVVLALEQVGYGTADTFEFSLGFSWSNLASLGSILYTGT